MTLEMLIYSDPVEPETLLNLAIRLAANQAYTGLDEENAQTSIRHLLDAYILLVNDDEDLNILKSESDILKAFRFEYTLVFEHSHNQEDPWWEDHLPRTHLPGAFVQAVGRIEGGRSKALRQAYQSHYIEGGAGNG